MYLLAPYDDFNKCAEAFRPVDLKAQANVGLRTMRLVLGIIEGMGELDSAYEFNATVWHRHAMFLGLYTEQLALHAGIKETAREAARLVTVAADDNHQEMGPPVWWGREVIHAAHRSYLVYLDPDEYEGRFPDDLPVFVPFPPDTLIAYM